MANSMSNQDNAAGNLTARAFREALYAGVIALGLFVLFIGLKTDQNIHNELVLVQRWGLLAIFVILAMIGRFVMVAYIQPMMASRKAIQAAEGEADSIASSFFRLPFVAIAVVLAVALPFLSASLSPTGAAYVTILRGAAIIYVLAAIFYLFRPFIQAHFAKIAIVALLL